MINYFGKKILKKILNKRPLQNIIDKCKKLKINITVKNKTKRVYKTTSLLKKQIAFKSKKVYKPISINKSKKVYKPVSINKSKKVYKPVSINNPIIPKPASINNPIIPKPVSIIKSNKCPEVIIKLYNELKNKVYNKNNAKKFKYAVNNLQEEIEYEKKNAGISFTKSQTDENRIRRILLMSKQLPDKPCIIDKSSILINNNNDGSIIIDNKTESYNYYQKAFNNCKNILKLDRIIIPVSIKNHKADKGSHHSNIIIVDLKTHEAWRIEPNNVSSVNVELFNNIYIPFFNKLNIKFQGFYPETCPIKHGGLCKYATFAQYLYGKDITYDKLKEVILQFLKDDINDLCEIN